MFIYGGHDGRTEDCCFLNDTWIFDTGDYTSNGAGAVLAAVAVIFLELPFYFTFTQLGRVG